MERDPYLENYLILFDTSQFSRLRQNETQTTERKVQRAVEKIKSKLPTDI